MGLIFIKSVSFNWLISQLFCKFNQKRGLPPRALASFMAMSALTPLFFRQISLMVLGRTLICLAKADKEFITILWPKTYEQHQCQKSGVCYADYDACGVALVGRCSDFFLLLIIAAKLRRASFTESWSGKNSATSGSITTTLVPSAYLFEYFPRTPPRKLYSSSISGSFLTFFIMFSFFACSQSGTYDPNPVSTFQVNNNQQSLSLRLPDQNKTFLALRV